MAEFTGNAYVICPNCEHEFYTEVTIDWEPENY